MIHNFDVLLSSACNPFAILGGIVQIKKIDFLFSLTSLLRRSLFELKSKFIVGSKFCNNRCRRLCVCLCNIAPVYRLIKYMEMKINIIHEIYHRTFIIQYLFYNFIPRMYFFKKTISFPIFRLVDKFGVDSLRVRRYV